MSTPIFHELYDEHPYEMSVVEPPKVRYPNVTVVLTGSNGSTGAIMDRVVTALMDEMRSLDMTLAERRDEIALLRSQAYAGTYEQMLCRVMEWVNVQ